MVTINELRIGNLLKAGDQICKVNNIFLSHFTVYNEADIQLNSAQSNITPILLSPEVLRACGFEKKIVDQGYNIVYRIAHESFWFKLYNHDAKFYFDPFEVNYQIEISHLHQLQNLYFHLCGKELSVSLSEEITA